VAGLARDLAHERCLEHEVRAEHAQVAVRGVVVVQRELRHHGVERDRPRVVGDDERAALGRHVGDAARLGAEPVVVHRAQRGHELAVGELGVEAELVDLVLPRDTTTQEVEPLRESRVHAPRGAVHVVVDRLLG